MRTYERLNAEVVKFEAQDVITGSVCTCTSTTRDHIGGPNGVTHYAKMEGPWWLDGWVACDADPDKHTCGF